MNNNHNVNNIHSQTNFTVFFNNETSNLQSSTNDVIQAEHHVNYNDVNVSYSSRYTGFSTMDDNILSPPAYTPVVPANYIANEQQFQFMPNSSQYIYHANNEPMQRIQNIPISPNMNVNHPEIFRFDIPGFQIVIIPVSSPLACLNNLNMQDQFQHDHTYLNYSSPNIITNNSQPQFQQSNYNNFSS